MEIIAFVMETETHLRAKIKEKSNRQLQCKQKAYANLPKFFSNTFYNLRKYIAQYTKGALLLQ